MFDGIFKWWHQKKRQACAVREARVFFCTAMPVCFCASSKGSCIRIGHVREAICNGFGVSTSWAGRRGQELAISSYFLVCMERESRFTSVYVEVASWAVFVCAEVVVRYIGLLHFGVWM